MEASVTENRTGRFAQLPSRAIQASGACDTPLKPEWAWNQRGKIAFMARFARLPNGADLRSVHIHGPKIEIINIFHFPPADRALPIYAMEFVVFGAKPVVGVIDAKSLNPHSYSEAIWRDTLLEAHRRFPDLVRADAPPDWYEECRSGLDFYTRPAELELMDRLVACHDFVWGRLAAAGENAPRLLGDEIERHAACLKEYKDHHRINSPGLPFLHRTFGEDWTDNFMRNALFA